MKPGAKRRRSKEEIKDAKRQEANRAKDMADAIAELRVLREKDAKHREERQVFKSKEKSWTKTKAKMEDNDQLVNAMWSKGVIKYNDQGEINIVDDENERQQLEQQYVQNEAMQAQQRRQTSVFHQGNEEASQISSQQQFVDAADPDKRE